MEYTVTRHDKNTADSIAAYTCITILLLYIERQVDPINSIFETMS